MDSKRYLLEKAAINYVKSLFEFNLTQKEHQVILEIKIDEEILFELNLNSISSLGNIYVGDGVMNIESPLNSERGYIDES
jgi:hypothetical protein